MEGLLQYIDQIDQSVADAEIDVLESLIESYDKSIMILENADDNTDLTSFDIFQEGEKLDKFKEDTKAPVFGNKGESVIKRLLMIIPRLIRKIVTIIQNFFTKIKSKKNDVDKDVANLEKIANSTSEAALKGTEKALQPLKNYDPAKSGIGKELFEDLDYAAKKYEQAFNAKEQVEDQIDSDVIQEALFKTREAKESSRTKETNVYDDLEKWKDDDLFDTFNRVTGYMRDLYTGYTVTKLIEGVKHFDQKAFKAYLDMDVVDWHKTFDSVSSQSMINLGIVNSDDVKLYVRRTEHFDSQLKDECLNRFISLNADSSRKEWSAKMKRSYIKTKLDVIKKIRDSINEIHKIHVEVMTGIKQTSTFLFKVYDKMQKIIQSEEMQKLKNDYTGGRTMSDERRSLYLKYEDIDEDIIKVHKIASNLSMIVSCTYKATRRISECWNAMMHQLLGENTSTKVW